MWQCALFIVAKYCTEDNTTVTIVNVNSLFSTKCNRSFLLFLILTAWQQRQADPQTSPGPYSQSHLHSLVSLSLSESPSLGQMGHWGGAPPKPSQSQTLVKMIVRSDIDR